MKSYWDFYRTLMKITASGMKVFCRCKGWIEITKGANLLLLLTWPNRKLSQPFHILPRCRNNNTQARNGCQNFDDASQGDQLTDLIIGPDKDLTNGSMMCDWGMKKIDANVTPSELIKILWQQIRSLTVHIRMTIIEILFDSLHRLEDHTKWIALHEYRCSFNRLHLIFCLMDCWYELDLDSTLQMLVRFTIWYGLHWLEPT